MPNPAEVAVVVVNGRKFDDWQSVFVEHRIAEGWSNFKFTAAEREPIPELWEKLQFRPLHRVEIYLGGQLALPGFITSRQVAYDAKGHHVQLIGKTTTWLPATSSVNSATGNFDGMTLEQVARKVLQPFPNPVKVIGKLDQTPFPQLQNQPGELIWDFLERIARVKGVIMGSDWMGNFLLIGDHSGSILGQRLGTPRMQHLIEGDNILKCQCIISAEQIFDDLAVSGSTPANDQRWGRVASEVVGHAKGLLERYRYLLTPAEQPLEHEMRAKQRAEWEALWSNGTILEAHVTVQGWLRDGLNLWLAGDQVLMKSPMAVLDEVLKIQTVTFTQDRNSGTTTTLHLRLPWALNEKRGEYRTQFPHLNQSSTVTGPAVDPPVDPSKLPKPGEERPGDPEPRGDPGAILTPGPDDDEGGSGDIPGPNDET